MWQAYALRALRGSVLVGMITASTAAPMTPTAPAGTVIDTAKIVATIGGDETAGKTRWATLCQEVVESVVVHAEDKNSYERRAAKYVVMALESSAHFFKPIDGANFCDMLVSHDKHLWSPTGASGTWTVPTYQASGALYLGGSTEFKEGAVGFWGHDDAGLTGASLGGGCCGPPSLWGQGMIMYYGYEAVTTKTRWTRVEVDAEVQEAVNVSSTDIIKKTELALASALVSALEKAEITAATVCDGEKAEAKAESKKSCDETSLAVANLADRSCSDKLALKSEEVANAKQALADSQADLAACRAELAEKVAGTVAETPPKTILNFTQPELEPVATEAAFGNLGLIIGLGVAVVALVVIIIYIRRNPDARGARTSTLTMADAVATPDGTVKWSPLYEADKASPTTKPPKAMANPTYDLTLSGQQDAGFELGASARSRAITDTAYRSPPDQEDEEDAGLRRVEPTNQVHTVHFKGSPIEAGRNRTFPSVMLAQAEHAAGNLDYAALQEAEAGQTLSGQVAYNASEPADATYAGLEEFPGFSDENTPVYAASDKARVPSLPSKQARV